MQDRGVDLGDLDLMARRSWDWLRVRVEGLLAAPPTVAPDGTLLPSTRIGWALTPPKGSDAAE